MKAIAASIVILAGAVLIAAGAVADRVDDAPLAIGYFLLLVGGVVFAASVLKPLWDAIPVDEKEKRDADK